MSSKLIALGNILMKDDGIAPKAAKYLEKELGLLNIEVIICETDIEFCVDKVQDGDIIFILDAVINAYTPGTVTLMPLEDIKTENTLHSQRQISILSYLNLINKPITWYIIGIEPYDISFSTELSPVLREVFHFLCDEIISIIKLLTI